MPTTNVLAAKPDVLAAPTGVAYPAYQQWGTVTCLAPKASNQLSVVNRDHTQISTPSSAYAADPSGVETKYNRRFTEYSYYTA